MAHRGLPAALEYGYPQVPRQACLGPCPPQRRQPPPRWRARPLPVGSAAHLYDPIARQPGVRSSAGAKPGSAPHPGRRHPAAGLGGLVHLLRRPRNDCRRGPRTPPNAFSMRPDAGRVRRHVLPTPPAMIALSSRLFPPRICATQAGGRHAKLDKTLDVVRAAAARGPQSDAPTRMPSAQTPHRPFLILDRCRAKTRQRPDTTTTTPSMAVGYRSERWIAAARWYAAR
jgi:hypothetical protein